MFQILARRFVKTRVRLVPLLLSLSILAGASTRMVADTIYVSGDLRTDATVTSCGPGCTLNSSNSDADYAQWAAVVTSFTVSTTSTMSAITYSYGGGTSLTGASVAAGGLEPYLSLFDASGNFLASTFFSGCPVGGNTYAGNCYDVSLDGGTLAAGTYYITLTAFENMSLAENLGMGSLSDGFTGLGNLAANEDLHYGYDITLTPTGVSPVPEPTYTWLAGMVLAGFCSLKGMKLYARSRV